MGEDVRAIAQGTVRLNARTVATTIGVDPATVNMAGSVRHPVTVTVNRATAVLGASSDPFEVDVVPPLQLERDPHGGALTFWLLANPKARGVQLAIAMGQLVTATRAAFSFR
jgi:hypothetical protein